MAQQNVNRAVLFNASTGNEVQTSGGYASILGLSAIPTNRIVNISQINYRAEVSQVMAVGSIAYTPTASTMYTVIIGDSNRKAQGYTEPLRKYSYMTPPVITTLGTTALLQAEAIHLALIAKINAQSVTNYVVAASLLLGAGFTITDAAGYYPYNRQGMNTRQGASRVVVAQNADGSGFASTNVVLTTAAVYSVGVGADLSNIAPVMDFMTGNITSGGIDAPKTISGAFAVSGQKYNCFSITYLSDSQIAGVTGTTGLLIKQRNIWVDNGAGAAVTNLAGYIAFERKMHRLVKAVYSNDINTQMDFVDNVILFQGPAGAVPATTGETKMVSDAKWVYNNIGTNVISTPTPSNAGLILDQTLTAGNGAEYTPSLLTLAPQEFVVGKQPFSIFVRISATTWANGAWQIGFRTKASHIDAFTYSNLAVIGSTAAAATIVSTQGILASATKVTTATAITLANAANYSAEVLVDILGVVTCKLNDVVYPVYSVGTTPLVLPAATIMVPTVRAVNVGGSAPVIVLSEVLALPTNMFKA